jgi:hypothetical protein
MVHPEHGNENRRGRVRAPEDGEDGEDVAYRVTTQRRSASSAEIVCERENALDPDAHPDPTEADHR